MKYFFLGIVLLLLPLSTLAAPRESFEVSDELRSSYAADLDYTSAWFDNFGDRFILARDWRVQHVDPGLFNLYSCNANELKQNFAPELLWNTGCKVIPGGTLLYGFFRDENRNVIGRIYLIQSTGAKKISNDAELTSMINGWLTVGAKSTSELFAIYQSGREQKLLMFNGGSWQESKNKELETLRISSRTSIAWSGSAWVISNVSRDLKLFDGNLVTDISGQAPLPNTPLVGVETNVAGAGMLLFSRDEAWQVVDSGYQSNLRVESKSVRVRSRGTVVEARLQAKDQKPLGTNIIYGISVNDGRRWFDVGNGEIVTTGESGDALRWEAVLLTNNPNSTPVLNTITLQYATEDTSSQGIRTRDNTRLQDLRRAQRYIQTNYNDTGNDPIVSNSFTKQVRWNLLKQSLIDGARSVRKPSSYWKSIERSFPEQPGDAEEYLYDYQSDSFGRSYLLSVTLEDASNRSLQNDLDGVVLGVNCNDPVYCIGQGPSVITAQQQTSFIPRTSGSLIRAANRPEVYVIQNGSKRWITNPQVFAKHGFRWEAVILVSQGEVNSYPTASPLSR